MTPSTPLPADDPRLRIFAIHVVDGEARHADTICMVCGRHPAIDLRTRGFVTDPLCSDGPHLLPVFVFQSAENYWKDLRQMLEAAGGALDRGHGSESISASVGS